MKKIETKNIGTCQSLKNIKILDVGCGGGLLTEVWFKYLENFCIINSLNLFQALARLNSNVTGIDPSKDLISIATDHSAVLRDKKIKYYLHIDITKNIYQYYKIVIYF